MSIWAILFCILVTVSAVPRDEKGQCEELKCVGEEYECIDGKCFCAPGFIPHPLQTKCIRCPGLGESCYGKCCNQFGNDTYYCWQGVCQQCYDPYGWTCRDNMKDIFLISSVQIAMGAAIIFGIVATFILLYKVCAVTNLSPLGRVDTSSNGRLSIGSLQLYIEERLRDAPPRYTRAPPAGSAVYPSPAYTNNGFVHDSSIPPPPYTPELKAEDSRNTTLHI